MRDANNIVFAYETSACQLQILSDLKRFRPLQRD